MSGWCHNVAVVAMSSVRLRTCNAVTSDLWTATFRKQKLTPGLSVTFAVIPGREIIGELLFCDGLDGILTILQIRLDEGLAGKSGWRLGNLDRSGQGLR